MVTSIVPIYNNLQGWHYLQKDQDVWKWNKYYWQNVHNPWINQLNFNFEGNITIEENCPLNGSIHSSKWTFQSKATIKLPIVCSLSSQKINCVAVKLKSGATKELHLSHYRMQIVEQNFEKEKIEKNSPDFIRLKIDRVITIKSQPKSLLENIKWPLIGVGASLISIIL